MAEQLKMWWNRQKVNPVILPDGFYVTHYKDENDIESWIDIVKNGLEGCVDTKEEFITKMLGHEGLKPENIFFIACKGENIATVTAVLYDNNLGYVHMVACKPEYRGLGLGNQLNNIVLNCLCENGCENVYLTTDDFRIPAVKSYLKAGFKPVLNGEDMTERWSKIAALIGVEELQAVDDTGKACGIIKAPLKEVSLK